MPELEDGPLTEVSVLELGNFIAGPFAGQLLCDCQRTTGSTR